ncbi:MAG: DUF523 domain-containing protein [Lachnospira sp.]|nr:DUF523 domain-containing protein [Lachnospira sp.]
MENILVSACLLGVHCRYDGKCQDIPEFAKHLPQLMEKYNLIPVCPEVFGGMTTPRLPSEIVSGKEGNEFRVRNSAGEDVTDNFVRGAKEAVHLAKLYNCRYAILKKRSPSCGSGLVYDGTFSKTLVEGDGVAAAMLKEAGVVVLDEESCIMLLKASLDERIINRV